MSERSHSLQQKIVNVDRRGLLLTGLTGTTALLAGCVGEGDDTDESNDETIDEMNREPNAEVVNTEVFTAPFFPDSEGADVPWIQVEVENSTDAPHREVRIESRLQDKSGSILETREGQTLLLPAETTWRYYLRQDETIDIEEIDNVENNVMSQEVGIRGEHIEDIEVIDASMSFDGSVVSVTGEVDIGDIDASRITIVARIYDEEDRFRGIVSDIETDPNATETIAFDAGLVGFRTPASMAQPDSFELLIVNGSV